MHVWHIRATVHTIINSSSSTGWSAALVVMFVGLAVLTVEDSGCLQQNDDE